LVEQLDKRLLVVLRDGRHLSGVMRSFDQFSNMVRHGTTRFACSCTFRRRFATTPKLTVI